MSSSMWSKYPLHQKMVIADYWGCPSVGAFEETYLQTAHALIVSEHDQFVSEVAKVDDLKLLCDSL